PALGGDEVDSVSRSTRVLLLLSVLTVTVAAASLVWGGGAVSPARALSAMTGSGDPLARYVVGELRLPRVILAAALGACLAMAGTVVQTVLVNPLADPGLLGVNAGSTCAILLLVQFTEAGSPLASALRPVASLAGATLAALGLLALLRRGSRVPPE